MLRRESPSHSDYLLVLLEEEEEEEEEEDFDFKNSFIFSVCYSQTQKVHQQH